MSATNEFIQFKGAGVWKQPSAALSGSKINHAVVITGWDDDRKAWRIRNSWGESFGDQGYAWIDYATDNIGRLVYWADVVPASDTPAIGGVDLGKALNQIANVHASVINQLILDKKLSRAMRSIIGNSQ
jgi:hypothetical protein